MEQRTITLPVDVWAVAVKLEQYCCVRRRGCFRINLDGTRVRSVNFDEAPIRIEDVISAASSAKS